MFQNIEMSRTNQTRKHRDERVYEIRSTNSGASFFRRKHFLILPISRYTKARRGWGNFSFLHEFQELELATANTETL